LQVLRLFADTRIAAPRARLSKRSRRGSERRSAARKPKKAWDPLKFLQDFYKAQRAHLEKKLLFGQRKERKSGRGRVEEIFSFSQAGSPPSTDST
jgi:hypothetical protein